MGEKKVTVMVLKTDLKCNCCYKKVLKLLCGFPQIRDRTFDENENTVTITVVCCDPEKFRHKLCNKARGSIKSIEIMEPDEPERVSESQPEPLEENTVINNETQATQEAQPESEQKPPPPAIEPVQEPPKPEPKANEPSIEPTQTAAQPVPMFGSVLMPICSQRFGGVVVGPTNFGFGVPSVYFEGYLSGRIGFGVGTDGPTKCFHPNQECGSVGHMNR